MNGSRTRSFANVYSRISCSGSSTGNGAGCPTRRALSGGIDQMSSVEAMKSSVNTVLSCGRPFDGSLADRARPVEATLAGHDHTLADVAQHRVGGAAERPPRTRTGRSLALLPDQLAAQEQTEIVLKDADDVGGQAAVRLATEIRHVHRDAAARFQLADALGEHLGEHLEVLEVRRGNALSLELLLVLLAGEVRRRGHDEGDRAVGDTVHPPGVAAARTAHRWRAAVALPRRRTAPADGIVRRTATSRGPLARPPRSWRSSSCVVASFGLRSPFEQFCGAEPSISDAAAPQMAIGEKRAHRYSLSG